MNSEHHVINAIIAASIMCCGCVIIGYVAFLYCRHNRLQRETEQQAKIYMQSQKEGGISWAKKMKKNRYYQPFRPDGRTTTLDISAHSGNSSASSSSQTSLLSDNNSPHSEHTPLLTAMLNTL